MIYSFRNVSGYKQNFTMKIRIPFIALMVALSVTTSGIKLGAQESKIDGASPIKFNVVSKLLNSRVRNGIGLKDLNGDKLPDLVIGSNAHRFDRATQTINADPNAGFRTNTPVPGHYQVSVHFNETRSTAVSVDNNPQLQVPITSTELAVPPG